MDDHVPPMYKTTKGYRLTEFVLVLSTHNQPRLAADKRGLLPWARAIRLIYPGLPKQEFSK
jgi:hypothetical protein